jgi:Na+/melibiose symporter-like transporter
VVKGAASSALDVGMNAQGAGVEVGYQRSIMVGFHAAWSFGALAAAAIGAVALALEVPARWHLGVIAVVIAGVAVASSPWLRIRDRARRTAQQRAPWLALPRGPLIALALVALGSTIGENVASDWSGIALADLVGVGEDRVAWGFVAFTGTMAMARLVGDRVTNHLGAATTIVVGGGVAAGGFLVVAAASWFPGALWVTLAGFAAVGMGVAVIVPLAFTLGARIGRTSGEGIAAVATVGYGGFVIAPPVVGFVA